jgi:hypothetical protein
MEGSVGHLAHAEIMNIPLETINAVANTVTALAVLWAGRGLRKSMLEAARLTAQYRLSRTSAPDDGETFREWLREQRPPD